MLGHLSAIFKYLKYKKNFLSWLGTIMACMVRSFTSISLLSVGISLRFFTKERSYQGLKDATSFSLLSDKSAEKSEEENSNICQFSILATWPTQSFVFARMQMRLSSHFRSENSVWKVMENLFQYFRIFGPKLLSTFSRLDNKWGGIL